MAWFAQKGHLYRLIVHSSLLLAALDEMQRPLLGQQPLITLLDPVPVGQTIPTTTVAGILTLSDLEILALTNNPTVPAAAALVTQQQGLLRQATLYPNPTAGYVRTDADQRGQTLTAGVFVSQEFVTPGKIRLAREAGQLEIRHADWQLQAQRTRVLNDVRIRYYELLGAQQAMAATAELETLASDGVSTAKRLLGIGQGTRPDILQAEMQLSAVKTSVQDAGFRYQAARRQLAHVVGLDDLPGTVVAGKLDQDIPSLDYQQVLDQILASSPILHAQQAQIQSLQAELRLAKIQAIPNVSIQLVAQRDSIQNYSTVSTLASMPIPVFNRNQGNILNVEGQLRQQQKELERLQLAIRDQLAVAFRQYQSLRNQSERLRAEILPRAKEHLELTTKAYQSGQFDFPRVLAARQTYFQTQLAIIDSLTELRKITIEIDGLLLTGGLNPTEVGTALQGQAPGGSAGIRGILLQQLQEQRSGASRTLPGAIQAGER